MTQPSEGDIRLKISDIVFPMFESAAEIILAIDSIKIADNKLSIDMTLGFYAESQTRSIVMLIQNAMAELGIEATDVSINTDLLASPSLQRNGQLAHVKNIVMVASGKGGVGKSTTAINLALALQAEGANVGILDADIYGPSMRTMLGVAAEIKPELVDNKYAQPIKKFGLKSMSVGYLSEEKTPMIWRGPMAVRALQQLLENTSWGELDYLIIDMPPGTGDIHISLAQKISVSAAVIVTTPQEMALTDARKGIEMFNKVGIPILGIIENMAVHNCSNCGFEEHIFGSGGAENMASDYDLKVLASLPLSKSVREHIDAGAPTVVSEPVSALAAAYLDLANHVAYALCQHNKSVNPGPKIQIIE
ncbi:MAG: ATP-binding protein involved in chromosome partitioning [Candidatus Endobugula sp.]|jgi:ATP-binding protein involved in chromosome partitioning